MGLNVYLSYEFEDGFKLFEALPGQYRVDQDECVT